MALAKLEIEYETAPGKFGRNPIVAQFNPEELRIERSVSWDERAVGETDAPELRFTHGNASTFPIDLFFDTYEEQVDVRRKHTAKVVGLSTIEGHGNLHHPPICKLKWGKFGEIFQGVLQSVTQRFTLFLEDGTPVRATLSCTFKQWRSAEHDAKSTRLQSADVAKIHVVRRGDTLSGIAGDQYHDPALWRPIARANRLDDPLRLEPGRQLMIPALPGGEERR